MGKFKIMYVWNLIKTLQASALSLYIAYFINNLFDLALKGSTSSILDVSILFIIIFILYKLITLIFDVVINKYIEKKKELYKKRVLENYVNYSKSKLSTQEVMKRLGSDFDKVYSSKILISSTLVSESLIVIVATFIIGYINLSLAVILIISVSLYALLPILFKADFTKIYSNVEKLEELIERELKEGIDNYQSIKTLNLEGYMIDRYEERIEASRIETIKAEKAWHTFKAVIAGVRQLIVFIFMGLIIYYTASKKVTINNVLLVVFLTNILKNKVEVIVKSFKQLIESRVSNKRFNELVVKENILDKYIDTIKYIKFVNFTFAYKELVFKDLNLSLEGNTLYKLEGANGAGKTTFINILLGELEDYDGKVLINNNNLKEFDKKSYRNNISYLSQSNFMFDGTTHFNLELHNTVDDELVDMFNIGTLLNLKAKDLSEGQKQRIAIVRALSKECDVLILDEPETFLDKGLIYKLVNYLKSITKLTILISHTNLLDELVNQKLVIEDLSIRRCK